MRLATYSLAALCSYAHGMAAPGDEEPLTQPPLQTAYSAVANFNPEVVRGMAIADNTLYAINSYESTIKAFSLSLTSDVVQPGPQFRTIHNPVSIAARSQFLYVIGAGTHGLAIHNKNSGAIVDYVDLPSEPADLVLDETRNKAWISCMGEDCVVEIDITGNMLGALRIHDQYGDGDNGTSNDGSLRLKRPRHLHLDIQRGQLFVAPFTTGNGSFLMRKRVKSGDGWDDLDEDNAPVLLEEVELLDGWNVTDPIGMGGLGWEGGPNPAPESVLPDEDLFTIQLDPQANPSLPRIRPIARRVSTLVTAHGRNPVSGDYWVLGIESKNLSAPSETELNGVFAENEVSFILSSDLPSPNSADVKFPSSTSIIDNSPATAISFPYALSFSDTGLGAIAGSTSSIIEIRDDSRAVLGHLDLLDTNFPISNEVEGRVPRSLLWQGDDLLVYCQQSGRILRYSGLSSSIPSSPSQAYELGNDPTPEVIAEGRQHWYDSAFSVANNVTCNTCHPGGETDGLCWPLSNAGIDVKDVMFTQSLKGIDDSFPYHWRGERDLRAFNDAFPGLLGHSAPLGTNPNGDNDYLALEEFIFSMQPPANPRGLTSREMETADNRYQSNEVASEPELATVTANPLRGFEIYTGQTDLSVNCNLCHTLPTGSNSIIQADNGAHPDGHALQGIQGNMLLEKIQLEHGLTFKQQPIVEYDHWQANPGGGSPAFLQRTYEFPLLGFGVRHNGENRSIEDFLIDQFAGIVTTDDSSNSVVSPQDLADLTSFLEQLDSGTPASAHNGVFWNVVTDAAANAPDDRIMNELIPAAQAGWIDLVVFGLSRIPGQSGPGSVGRQAWTYDPSDGMFVSNGLNPSGSIQAPSRVDLSWFDPSNGNASNLFLGCLSGHGRRLGQDIDDDGILDFHEIYHPQGPLNAWDPDTDGDLMEDGLEDALGGDPNDEFDTPVDNVPPQVLNAIAGSGFFSLNPVFVTPRQAKFHIEADEKVHWVIAVVEIDSGGAIVGPPIRNFGYADAFSHTIMLHDLREPYSASAPRHYVGGIYAFDSNNQFQFLRIDFETPTPTGAGRPGERFIVVDDLQWDSVPTPTAGGKSAKVSFRSIRNVDRHLEDPPFQSDTVPALPTDPTFPLYPVFNIVRRSSPDHEWKNSTGTVTVAGASSNFANSFDFELHLDPIASFYSPYDLNAEHLLEPPFFVLDPGLHIKNNGVTDRWEIEFEVAPNLGAGELASDEIGIAIVGFYTLSADQGNGLITLDDYVPATLWSLPETDPENRFLQE